MDGIFEPLLKLFPLLRDGVLGEVEKIVLLLCRAKETQQAKTLKTMAQLGEDSNKSFIIKEGVISSWTVF